MQEEWKWITGYEGIYQISNCGNVKSFRKYKDGYVLSNQNRDGWYFTINLYDINGKRKTTRIHVLVAQHFMGEIPVGFHVHHKDGNKQNNHVDNLEIIHPVAHRKETEKDNPQIISGIVCYNKYKKPKHVIQYTKDGQFIAEYVNAKIASVYTGICVRNILQCASGDDNGRGYIRKSAGGFIWKFKEVMQCGD